MLLLPALLATAALAPPAAAPKPVFYSVIYRNHAYNARVSKVGSKRRLELAAACGTSQDGQDFPDRTTGGTLDRRGRIKLGADRASVSGGVRWTTDATCGEGKRRTFSLRRVTAVAVRPGHYRPAPMSLPIWGDGGVDVSTVGGDLGIDRGMHVGFVMGCDPAVGMLQQQQKLTVAFNLGITMDGRAAGKMPPRGVFTGLASLRYGQGDKEFSGTFGAGGCNTPAQNGAGGGSFGVRLVRVG